MTHFHRFSIALAALLTAAFPATAQAPAQAQAQAPVEAASEYVLGQGDVIEVDVLGQTEFKTRARIRSDGTIALPFLGNVTVTGETPTAVAQKVAGALNAGGYYISPVVSVEVVGYASRYVIVLGAVGQPGIQPVDRDYRVSEIIARAGGLKENSADQLLLRRANGEEIKLDYQAIATGAGAEDPYVQAGDKLFVPLAENFYIYGQVNAPGAYALKDKMTLRQALARSGGLTASGSDKRISIFRGGKKSRLSLDEAILPGDVVVVGERFF